MGTNNFNNKVQSGDELKSSDINQFQDALNETVVGRQDGIPTRGKNLGSIPTPWGTVYTEGLNVQGDDVDLSSLSRERYSIVSGATGSGNSVAQFIQGINNQTGQFRILGDGTDLVLTINGRRVVINQDIDFTIPFDVSLNLGINIKDAARAGLTNIYENSMDHDFFESGHIGKNAGNKDVVYSNDQRIFSGVLPVSLVDLTGGDATQRALIDQFKAQRESFFNNGLLWLFSIGNPASPNSVNQAHREYFLARGFKVDSSYLFIDVKRRHILLSGNASGNSFNIFQIINSSSTRQFRDVFDTGTASNRYGVTRHSLYWVFIDADNPTNVITQKNEPVYARSTDSRVDNATAWFNLETQQWHFRNATNHSFVIKDIIPIGIVSNGYKTQSNGAGTLLARSFNFTKKYEKTNTIRLHDRSGFIESKEEENVVSVYGTTVKTKSKIKTQIPNGLSNGTAIYLYLSDQGTASIELNTPPVYHDDLQGYYHPTKSWRCIGHHVTGNVFFGMSFRYSNNEEYKNEYKCETYFDGKATSTRNDMIIPDFLFEGQILRMFIQFSRPVRINNVNTYNRFFYTFSKNNFFRSEEEKNGVFTQSIQANSFFRMNSGGTNSRGTTNASIGTTGGRKYFFISNFTFAASSSGRIVVTVNRMGMDSFEKRLWNELS